MEELRYTFSLYFSCRLCTDFAIGWGPIVTSHLVVVHDLLPSFISATCLRPNTIMTIIWMIVWMSLTCSCFSFFRHIIYVCIVSSSPIDMSMYTFFSEGYTIVLGEVWPFEFRSVAHCDWTTIWLGLLLKTHHKCSQMEVYSRYLFTFCKVS